MDHDDREFAAIYAAVSRAFCGQSRVRILRGLLHEVCRGFPAGYFDWLYLDACHARECVAEDLQDWWPKLKPGGVFAGHDYWDTVQFPWIDVRSAVDEFLAGSPWKTILRSGSKSVDCGVASAVPGRHAPASPVRLDSPRTISRTRSRSIVDNGLGLTILVTCMGQVPPIAAPFVVTCCR